MSDAQKTGIADGYIHSFTRREQDRLIEQARVLENIIFAKVDFKNSRNIIEIGSGVGAQTKILLERYPNAHVQCVDASQAQVARAGEFLKDAIDAGQVDTIVGDALNLPFDNEKFDGAFICWLLEHVQNPVEIIREARRVLKPGSPIFCNEVFNSTFYVHPYSPATMKFWFEFNDYQWSLKGDPFVGAKLANYLLTAGFKSVETHLLTQFYDNRDRAMRARFTDYWTGLLLSAADGLIAANRVTPEIVAEMRQELEALKSASDSVIFFSWILAQAKA